MNEECPSKPDCVPGDSTRNLEESLRDNKFAGREDYELVFTPAVMDRLEKIVRKLMAGEYRVRYDGGYETRDVLNSTLRGMQPSLAKVRPTTKTGFLRIFRHLVRNKLVDIMRKIRGRSSKKTAGSEEASDRVVRRLEHESEIAGTGVSAEEVASYMDLVQRIRERLEENGNKDQQRNSIEMLELLDQGYSLREISEKLNLSYDQTKRLKEKLCRIVGRICAEKRD